MAKLVKVAQVDDLAPGQGKAVQAEGRDIALFNVDGAFHAVCGSCLHRGGPLCEGELKGMIVTCPWHGWQYDVTSGANVRNPDPEATLASFPVRIEGLDVLVEIPE